MTTATKFARLVFVLACFSFAIYVFLPSGPSVPAPAKPTIDKSPQLQAQRQALIEKMINEQQLFTKVERNGVTMPRAWATPRFMALDLNSKQNFLGVIYAYYLDGSDPDRQSVALIDAQTGKEIGRFRNSGLDLD